MDDLKAAKLSVFNESPIVLGEHDSSALVAVRLEKVGLAEPERGESGKPKEPIAEKKRRQLLRLSPVIERTPVRAQVCEHHRTFVPIALLELLQARAPVRPAHQLVLVLEQPERSLHRNPK